MDFNFFLPKLKFVALRVPDIMCSGLQKTHLFCTREQQSAFWPSKVIQGR